MQNTNFWYSLLKNIRISPEKISHITGEVYWPWTTFTPNSGKLEKIPLVYRQRQKNIRWQYKFTRWSHAPKSKSNKNCPRSLAGQEYYPED